MKLLEVKKFGGTSMADAKAMEQSGSVVRNSHETGQAMLVVASAMSGVTDQLRNAIRTGVKKGLTEERFRQRTIKGISGRSDEGETGDYWEVFRSIAHRRHELIDGVVDSKQAGPLHQMVQDLLDEATGYVNSMVKLQFLSPKYFDWICSRLGEGSDAPILHAHLRAAGVDAVYYDASNVIVTDGNFGNANPLINSTRNRIKDNLARDLAEGRVVVMGGYYGADKDGNLTTFSRGGSDLSATAMGHVLTPLFDPIKVCLYKADVPGVMSADPKIVHAHIIPHMLYEEAAALTALGGKVIHPRAVHQAVRSGSAKRSPFPIYVKSTTEPQSPGTLIDNRERSEDSPVKAISLIKNAVSLAVTGWGMDRPGIMRKITGVLAERGVDIDFITQPHSKLALSLAFQYAGEEIDLEKAIREGLADEIKGNDVDMVRAMRVGVIGVIGKGLSDPRILGKVIAGMNGDFPELRRPNAYKLTTGGFEASILVDLPEERLKQLVQSIHDSVFGN